MSFERPTLPALIDRAIADIESALPGADARLRRSNLNVLARMHAGASHGLYGYLAWLARQVLPDTAEAEYLERHASIWGVQRQTPAAATGTATATGASGVVIPAGTRYKRADDAEFVTTAEATIAGGAATLSLAASLAGQDGNTAAGSTLNIESPIAGLNAAATVDADGLSGGADSETDAALRARLLARIRKPPQGGAQSDYVAWALEVPGVTRAWCYPGELGAGTVTVRFVRDDDVSLIPDAGEVTAVQDHIDALRPVTAAVTVVAPVAVPLDYQIELTPDTAAVRAAVEAELRDLLRREAEPGAAILLSHIREAISIAAGETDHNLVAPAADVAHATGQMATFGAITWL